MGRVETCYTSATVSCCKHRPLSLRLRPNITPFRKQNFTQRTRLHRIRAESSEDTDVLDIPEPEDARGAIAVSPEHLEYTNAHKYYLGTRVVQITSFAGGPGAVQCRIL